MEPATRKFKPRRPPPVARFHRRGDIAYHVAQHVTRLTPTRHEPASRDEN
jgi:hypothetical protein